jgi:hypothetical protein
MNSCLITIRPTISLYYSLSNLNQLERKLLETEALINDNRVM